jgi:hypothetical protein
VLDLSSRQASTPVTGMLPRYWWTYFSSPLVCWLDCWWSVHWSDRGFHWSFPLWMLVYLLVRLSAWRIMESKKHRGWSKG